MYSALKAKLKKIVKPAQGRFADFSKNSKIDSAPWKQFQVTKIGEWVDPIIVFDVPTCYWLCSRLYQGKILI